MPWAARESDGTTTTNTSELLSVGKEQLRGATATPSTGSQDSRTERRIDGPMGRAELSTYRATGSDARSRVTTDPVFSAPGTGRRPPAPRVGGARRAPTPPPGAYGPVLPHGRAAAPRLPPCGTRRARRGAAARRRRPAPDCAA